MEHRYSVYYEEGIPGDWKIKMVCLVEQQQYAVLLTKLLNAQNKIATRKYCYIKVKIEKTIPIPQ